MKHQVRIIVGSLFSLALCLGLAGCAGGPYPAYARDSDKSRDAEVTESVERWLQADPEVSGMPIRVQTYRGEVQLTGMVDAETQKERAAELARKIRGVQWVRNDIEVR
jgi:hyperosmotically inducible periplasmic protein